MTIRLLAFLGLITAAATAQEPSPQQQVDNVAAFARLYGVARYFYPGDSAATLDWDRFAVYGVARVRLARSTADLQVALRAVFSPIGDGIVIAPSLTTRRGGDTSGMFVTWRYDGPGITTMASSPYRAVRTNRAAPPSRTTNFIAFNQAIIATPLQGATIRMRARARLLDPNTRGWGGLWLRVDRANGTGFFDNMEGRPIRDTSWREYVIEGPVAQDAKAITFGALASGDAPIDVDAFEVSMRLPGADWKVVEISDGGFENPAGSRWGTGNNPRITRQTSGAFEGRQFLRLAAPAIATASPAVAGTPVTVSATAVDVDLGSGLKARVPLALSDLDARSAPAGLGAHRAAVLSIADPRGRDDVDVRLADVVVAWNVFRHFYPYFTEAATDWDARLGPQLLGALRATDARAAHRDAVREVVADARDGHGSVNDMAVRGANGALPVQLRVLDNRLVVIGSKAPDVRVGSVVNSIDGADAAPRVATETRLASGTQQWREWVAARAMGRCTLGSGVKVAIDDGIRPREVTLECGSLQATLEARPDSIAEVQPGIWYVDVTRAQMAAITPVLPKLAAATGIIIDMRGYPTDAGAKILPHLVTTGERDNWMHVAMIDGPFGRTSGWNSFGWNVAPAEPHLGARRVFLTDGRAISYAESVMGYIRDHKLGTIIGGTTAGANGNVAMFTVPGGYNVVFTGMRVTRHDGVAPYHLLGVPPEIPLVPTITGLRAGRDELLERALNVVRPVP